MLARARAHVRPLQSQIKAPAPEALVETVAVPLKYHHAVTQQGNFFRILRTYGVQVEQSAHPQKSAVPVRPEPDTDTPAPAAPSTRIDDTDDEPAAATAGAAGAQWEVVLNYQDAEEGESTWTLKARDRAALDRARQAIDDALARAQGMSHVGFLTLPDRASFPRIVGAKGSNIARLHGETGADITVGRENNTIVIMGACLSLVLSASSCVCWRGC